MTPLDNLFDNNAKWAKAIKKEDPTFFERLAAQQHPDYLWIGCADSRVPANDIVGLLPGELFVHRNIANCVVHTDLNCLSVIYYAVRVLKVKHIIVCGHYGCGGVKAALENRQTGLPDHWIRNIRDVYMRHQSNIDSFDNETARINALCEQNVAHQVSNVSQIPAVQNAWYAGQELVIHGWIYDIADGLLKCICKAIKGIDQVPAPYRLVPQEARVL